MKHFTFENRNYQMQTNNMHKIYRFKFTNDVVTELTYFAKLHQYDDNRDFKEAWKKWLQENEEIVLNETNRLHDIGYSGQSVPIKMYKAARYYFRNKQPKLTEQQKQSNTISIVLNENILELINNHVNKNINNKPSNGYDDFCLENKLLLQQESINLRKIYLINSDDVYAKIKKTYKNKHYILKSAKKE